MKTKKPLILLVTLSFLIFGGACFTPMLYDKPMDKSHSFMEEVSSFLITKEGNKLIVIGKEHHYIFESNDTLKFILQWSEKKRVKASFSSFNIKTDQSLLGSYDLSVHIGKDLSSETKALLIAKGFTENTALKILNYHGTLQGERYLADNVKIPVTMQLNKKYHINMIEDASVSASRVAKRILLTPIALLADGLLVIGGIPILLLSQMFD
jgi:hypothetical protein